MCHWRNDSGHLLPPQRLMVGLVTATAPPSLQPRYVWLHHEVLKGNQTVTIYLHRWANLCLSGKPSQTRKEKILTCDSSAEVDSSSVWRFWHDSQHIRHISQHIRHIRFKACDWRGENSSEKTFSHRYSILKLTRICLLPCLWWWYYMWVCMCTKSTNCVLNIHSSLYINYTLVKLFKKENRSRKPRHCLLPCSAPAGCPESKDQGTCSQRRALVPRLGRALDSPELLLLLLLSRSVVSNSSDPMDCSPPGSSIHGIFQTRVLEWGAIAFSGLTWAAIPNPQVSEVYLKLPSNWEWTRVESHCFLDHSSQGVHLKLQGLLLGCLLSSLEAHR